MSAKNFKYVCAIAGLCLLALVGCNTEGDKKICSYVPSSIDDGDVLTCVHQWSYRLASSDEPAIVVARATVTACDGLAKIAARAVADRPATQAAGDPDVEYTKAYKANIVLAEKEALFRVIQARAGKCEVP